MINLFDCKADWDDRSPSGNIRKVSFDIHASQIFKYPPHECELRKSEKQLKELIWYKIYGELIHEINVAQHELMGLVDYHELDKVNQIFDNLNNILKPKGL